MKSIFLFSVLVLFSCSDSKSIENFKKEVMQTEQAFAQMARKQGVEKAFLAFAADSAVLNRSDKILKGKDDFKNYFSNPLWQKATLTWEPDFIDVSTAGDLAYTYGSYSFISTDSSGKADTSTGIFHTVWKRQKDGSWKFVWD